MAWPPGSQTARPRNRPECSPLFPTIFRTVAEPPDPGPPAACDGDFQLVATHYQCSLAERQEMHEAFMRDPAAAQVCFRELAAEIRDRLAAGAAAPA